MKLTLVLLAGLLAVAAAAPGLTYISVTNGGVRGVWRGFELCPIDTGAAAFTIKIDYPEHTPYYDSTNLNAVRLHCNNGKDPQETLITSGEGK